jgi:hypothetical protein
MSKKPILSQRVLEQHTLNRYERERRTRKIVVIGSIVVTLLVLLLIAAAALQILVFEPNRAVAAVNGTDISVAQVQSRMKLEFADLTYNYNQLASQVQQLQRSTNQNDAFLVQFYQQQLQQMGARGTTEQVARNSLDALIDEILVRQEAQRRGITVTSDDVQQEVEKSIGFYRSTLTPFPTYTPVTPEPTLAPTATPLTVTKPLTATKPITPSPTLAPLPTSTPRLQPTSISQAELQQGRERGAQFYTALGYPAAQFERAYETILLTRKVQDMMAKEVPTRTQHYEFNYVRFNTIETATQYARLLASGQITFDLMITQSNTITQPAPIGSGSHRDWTSKASVESQFGNEVLAALEAGPLNKPTTLITSSLTNGYYILLPLGREVRALEESELQQVQQKNYSDWLTAAKADANKVQRKFDPLTVMPRDLKTSIDQFQQSISANQSTGSGSQGGQ